MPGENELKLNVTNVSFGGNTESLKPKEGETTNFYRQQDVFTQAKEKTMATPEVEDVTMEVTDDGASKRDLQAYDIAARPYNISGFKVMAGSDMYNKFLELNGDDFTLGMNDRGEQVMLFDKAKSDGKIKMFSAEKDENGNEYYAIRDNDGVVHKFDKDGKDITKTHDFINDVKKVKEQTIQDLKESEKIQQKKTIEKADKRFFD